MVVILLTGAPLGVFAGTGESVVNYEHEVLGEIEFTVQDSFLGSNLVLKPGAEASVEVVGGDVVVTGEELYADMETLNQALQVYADANEETVQFSIFNLPVGYSGEEIVVLLEEVVEVVNLDEYNKLIEEYENIDVKKYKG